MTAVVAIQIDAKAGFARVASTFGRLPSATERAQSRALRKLSTWLRRQVLIAASQVSQVPQAFFKRAVRYHVTQGPGGLAVWVGTNPIPAHRLGVVRWTRRMRGARVGRRSYPGAWSWGRGKTGRAIMSRTSSSRLPIQREMVQVHDPVLARLQGVQADAAARFDRLLRQELNYALTVEGR